MSAILDLEPAARQVAVLLDGVADDGLDARTPCEAYTVGDLLDHLMGLSVAFTWAATKASSAADGEPDLAAELGPGQPSVTHLDPGWRASLPGRLEVLAAAWKDSSAWEGLTEAGGVALPADVMGSVALNELVIHGWDIARATRQPFACDAASTRATYAFTSLSSEPGADRGGLFGPVVTVPPDAPLLDRALGLSGRDPSWTP